MPVATFENTLCTSVHLSLTSCISPIPDVEIKVQLLTPPLFPHPMLISTGLLSGGHNQAFSLVPGQGHSGLHLEEVPRGKGLHQLKAIALDLLL